LANRTPEEFATVADQIPERLTGGEFLARYRGVSDSVVKVDSERVYPVRVATAHPIYEHARVQEFAEQLSSFNDSESQGTESFTARTECLGRLVYASHASYSSCGLGWEGTDALVALVQSAGPKSGLYGAKITGGGSGGTVAILGRTDAGP